MSADSVLIGARKIRVWPKRQPIIALDEPLIRLIDCDDLVPFHDELRRALLKLRDDPAHSEWIFKGGCGLKVRDIPRWGNRIATLLHRRAVELFRQVFAATEVVVDCSWASLYGQGDYCMPHSHVRSVASVVYLLDPGDPDEADPLSGKFCFVDPRIAGCCKIEPDRLTHPLLPEMRPGSMLIFPAELVHCVNAYNGTAPRITLTWNFHTRALAGSSDSFGTSRLAGQKKA